MKLIQRMRSIEKILGIEFKPDEKEDVNDNHVIKPDGRLDKIDKIEKTPK